jgi:hypothetical protein
MAERFPTEVIIGGKVPTAAVSGLLEAIRTEGLYLDWSDTDFDVQTADDLLAAVGKDGLLHLTDADRSWGEVKELEAYLRENNIAYDKLVSGKYEYDAGLASFRPDMGEPYVSVTTADFCPVVAITRVKEARDLLRQSKPRAALELLEELCGPEVPDLEKLEIV